jgi:hypothetical protein
MTRAQLDVLDKPAEGPERAVADNAAAASETASPGWLVYAAWMPIAIPLVWAVGVTVQKALLIFSHT